MWTSIQKILPQKRRALGIGFSFDFFDLQKKWDQIIGLSLDPAFQNKSKPIKIVGSVLVVDCLNSIWANELQIKEQKVLAGIKKSFSKITIDKIKFIS